MLNKRERFKALEIFRICSNLGPFPIQVDLASSHIERASTKKQWICGIAYSFFLLHVLFKNWSLTYAYLFVPDTPLHQLVIHAIMAVGTIMFVFWYNVLFLPSPALFAAWVEITLRANICLKLYVSTFNNVNSCLIFTWKLVSISISIGAGYAAIAHFHQHPIMCCMYYVALFDCATCYAAIYEKAFKIPKLFDQVAECAKLHLHGNRMEGNGLFRRQIKSIPPTGIKVGHFHKLERASTLIFMDYVVVNIVNMLVAYD